MTKPNYIFKNCGEFLSVLLKPTANSWLEQHFITCLGSQRLHIERAVNTNRCTVSSSLFVSLFTGFVIPLIKYSAAQWRHSISNPCVVWGLSLGQAGVLDSSFYGINNTVVQLNRARSVTTNRLTVLSCLWTPCLCEGGNKAIYINKNYVLSIVINGPDFVQVSSPSLTDDSYLVILGF